MKMISECLSIFYVEEISSARPLVINKYILFNSDRMFGVERIVSTVRTNSFHSRKYGKYNTR